MLFYYYTKIFCWFIIIKSELQRRGQLCPLLYASLPSSTPTPPLESKMKSFMQGIKSNFTNEESGDVANIGSVASSFNASIRAIKSKFGGNE